MEEKKTVRMRRSKQLEGGEVNGQKGEEEEEVMDKK